MFKHKSTSGSNCFVTFILPEGALFVYQLFAEQSIILNLKQKRNPVYTEFLFYYLNDFCPSLVRHFKKGVISVKRKYSVIVIGAGSVGMAAGYNLGKRGVDTLLIDAHNPPHQKGSHHGKTRLIRHASG